mgnify:CR=1 FL=1
MSGYLKHLIKQRHHTDGSSARNPGPAGAGGLSRDHLGHCIAGFSRNLGHATNVLAELWGIRDGLSLASSLNLQNVELELDATTALQLIESADMISPLMNRFPLFLTADS